MKKGSSKNGILKKNMVDRNSPPSLKGGVKKNPTRNYPVPE